MCVQAVVLAAAKQSRNEKDIAAALRTTYPDNLYQAAQSNALQVEAGDEPTEDDMGPEDDTFDDEVEEQDAVDALLRWKQTRAGINQTKMARGFGVGKDFKRLAIKLDISVETVPRKARDHRKASPKSPECVQGELAVDGMAKCIEMCCLSVK